MFANTHFEIRMWGALHLPPSFPEGFRSDRNSNDWIYWLKNSEGAVLVPRHQASYSQMTGVFNHLFSIVFKFHCHSQKVTGSLGGVLYMSNHSFHLLSGVFSRWWQGVSSSRRSLWDCKNGIPTQWCSSDSQYHSGPSKTNTHPKIHMDTKNDCFAKW